MMHSCIVLIVNLLTLKKRRLFFTEKQNYLFTHMTINQYGLENMQEGCAMEISDFIALIILIIYFIIALLITAYYEKLMRKEGDISRIDAIFCIITGFTWFISFPLLVYLKYRKNNSG